MVSQLFFVLTRILSKQFTDQSAYISTFSIILKIKYTNCPVGVSVFSVGVF
jgi:hypothetical protein